MTVPIVFYQLTIIPHGDCASRYGKEVVTDRILCASSDSEKSCQPDSGGPLVVRSSSGSYTLAGIMSMGMICGSGGSLGVFTNITTVNDWLVDNMIV